MHFELTEENEESILSAVFTLWLYSTVILTQY